MNEKQPFRSQRSIDAENRANRIEAFDRLIDLALDGTITLDEAIEAYKFDGELYVPQSSEV